MIGIAQNHLGAGRPHLLDNQSFDRPLRAHRHEARRFDGAAQRVKPAPSGVTTRVDVFQLKSVRPRAHLLVV